MIKIKLSNIIKIRTDYIEYIFLYVFSRFAFICITNIFKIQPFICYDDSYTYDNMINLPASTIFHETVVFRNCYFFICSHLNNIRFLEWITGPRILNFFLWYFVGISVYKIYNLLYGEKIEHKYLLFAFALIPTYIIYSMAVLREVICAWALITLILLFCENEILGERHLIKAVITGIVLFFTRALILEVVIILYCAYKYKEITKAKRLLLVLAVVSIVVTVLTRNSDYLYVINDKVNAYLLSENEGTGFLSKISVSSPKDFYKLPLLLFYVQITPLPGTVDPYFTKNSWSHLLGFSSGIFAFLLIYFWIYFFGTQKSRLEKYIVGLYLIFLTLIAVSSPNNSRFFFFLSPLYIMLGHRGIETIVEKYGISNLLLGFLSGIIPYIYLFVH